MLDKKYKFNYFICEKFLCQKDLKYNVVYLQSKKETSKLNINNFNIPDADQDYKDENFSLVI